MNYEFDQLKVKYFLLQSGNVKKVERKNKIIDVLAFFTIPILLIKKKPKTSYAFNL